MLNIREHPVSIMVMFAIALHLLWSFLILIDVSALNTTGLGALRQYIHSPYMVSLVTFSVAIMALIGVLSRTPWLVLLLLPQQVILMMSAAGAIEAMWLSQFADGVIRSRAFLVADQAYSVIAAIGHTVAVLIHINQRFHRW